MNPQQVKEESLQVRKEMKKHLGRDLPLDGRMGAWSPLEVFHHVLLVNQLSLNILERLFSRAKDLPENHPLTLWPVREELGVFPLERAFSVPAFTGTDPDRLVTLETLEALEKEEAEKYASLLDKSSPYDCSGLIFPHPLMGRMNFYKWIYFGVVHERLHLEKLIGDLELNESSK